MALEIWVDFQRKKDLKMKDRMLQFFSYDHLPREMQEVSRPFCELARRIVETLPSNPERTVSLRKLLEAKDCAVRALIYKDMDQNQSSR